jgi:hypothetical protein
MQPLPKHAEGMVVNCDRRGIGRRARISMRIGPVPTCPKCGMNFAYTDTHVCEGRDYARLGWIAAVAVGAAGGGLLGHRYGFYFVNEVCGKPDASSLCGLVPSFYIPVFEIFGAGVGALATMIAVVVLMTTRRP